MALVWGSSADGKTLGVLRKRGERVKPGLIRKVSDGQPIHGELVRLKPRQEPHLFDVEVLHDARPQKEQTGPAQVASDAYRRGWDRLFKKTRSSQRTQRTLN